MDAEYTRRVIALKAMMEDVPEHMRDGLALWVLYGIPPGDFLTALLANDLAGAVGRADTINQYRIKDIITWVYSYAPSNCWGSYEKLAKWTGSLTAPVPTPPSPPASGT